MEDSISYGEEVKLLEDVKDKVGDGVEEPPDRLPNGWIMQVKLGDDAPSIRYDVYYQNICKDTSSSVGLTHIHDLYVFVCFC